MRIFPLFICCICLQPLQSQSVLTITSATQPPYDVNTLIDNFFAGTGIQVLNVEFSGEPDAVGFFSGGADVVGLNRGLLLTTGAAATLGDALGGEETGADFANTNNSSMANLPVLSQISTAPLFDVMYYRITFRPFGDSIRFRYVFASEEYPEYACTSFNDIFAFFLDGPVPGGTSYQQTNIALIPGTSLPVAINNIHPANPVQNCVAFNEDYFVNNNGSNTQPVYDGFTVPFIAEAAVVPCETYQMTIAIADAGDGIFDSSVFLEGSSFGGAIDVSTSFSPAENVIPENALGDTIVISFAGIPAAVLPLSITLGGDAINGTDYQPVDTMYTVVSTDTVLYLLFQPIVDNETENMESIIINVLGAGCLTHQFTLFISDSDSSMLQGQEVYALVNGMAHLSAPPTAESASDYSFSNETEQVIEPYSTLVSSEIQVALPIDVLYDVRVIQSVCLDIAHPWLDDLDIYLIAPGDRFVELTTDNGANGDNYTGTCFSPDASTPIHFPGPFAPAEAAPFTGVFQPEGVWDDILTSPVNGTWKLGIIDDHNAFTGTLEHWSMTFSGAYMGGFKYEWSTGDTTATIDVTSPGIYSVVVRNAVSHLERTFLVTDEVNSTQTPDTGLLQITPNPARDMVWLNWDNTLIVNGIQLFDRSGKLILQRNVAAFSQQEKLDIKGLPTDTYLVVLNTDRGPLVKKLVKG